MQYIDQKRLPKSTLEVYKKGTRQKNPLTHLYPNNTQKDLKYHQVFSFGFIYWETVGSRFNAIETLFRRKTVVAESGFVVLKKEKEEGTTFGAFGLA